MDFESKKIWRYGDDVDTDVIIPARYLAIADWNELAEHAMEDIDTTFAPNVKAGEIMVAGKNFGCGSSREHAPGVIKAKGVPVIIAHSFARIFFRNAINIAYIRQWLAQPSPSIPECHTPLAALDQDWRYRNRPNLCLYSLLC